MIRVFVGTEGKQSDADEVLWQSIAAHCSCPGKLEIRNMDADITPWSEWKTAGPTGFTMFRFAIPELCSFTGQAIYLDCDMLLLADIAELAALGQHGKWVKAAGADGDCVSVIDCAAMPEGYPTIAELKRGVLRKWDVRAMLEPIMVDGIPPEWNSTDRLTPDTKLLHFSDLTTQPWMPGAKPHRDPEAVRLWQTYR